MAYKFVDSWKQYATSDLLRMWTQFYGSGAPFTVEVGLGSRGGRVFQAGFSLGGFQGMGRTLVPGDAHFLAGTRFKGTGTAGGWTGLFTPANGGNSLNLVSANTGALDNRVNVMLSCRNAYYTHVAASINTNGTMSLYRGNADSGGGGGLVGQDRISATLGTSVDALQFDQYHYIELDVDVHPTAGTARLIVNGDEWITFSGRTQADGASSVTEWQEIAIGSQLSNLSASWLYEDLYCGDTDLSDPFNQLAALTGDAIIEYSNVFEDGTTLDWTPLTGTDHFDMVDEIPPDLDVTYNIGGTAGFIDTFNKTAVPIVGKAVLALVPIYLMRRVSGGNTTSAAVIRDAGTNFSGSRDGSGTAVGNTGTYTYDWWAVTQRPSNSATPLTQALADAMEVGYLQDS